MKKEAHVKWLGNQIKTDSICENDDTDDVKLCRREGELLYLLGLGYSGNHQEQKVVKSHSDCTKYYHQVQSNHGIQGS
jgi:hypothetical protein